MRTRVDRGQATVWLVVMVLVAVVSSVLVVRMDHRAATLGRAQDIADLAALAAVSNGPSGAHVVAQSNGAMLVTVRCDDSQCGVRIQYEGMHATAEASNSAR